MPPRFAYWTIIFGGQPTAFRSATRDELLPTFKQIQSKNPDAQLRYFARGKLWYSDEEAKAALIAQRNRGARRETRGEKPPFARGGAGSGYGGTNPHRREERPGPPKRGTGEGGRGRGWRPGGAHTDPRDRFKVPRDVKRARFKAKLQRDRSTGEGAAGRRRDPRPFRRPFKKKDEE